MRNLHQKFEEEIKEALQNNDADLFSQLLSYCFEMGYREHILDLTTADHDVRVRGKEYKMPEPPKTPGILKADGCKVGDIITVRSFSSGNLGKDRRLEIMAGHGNYWFLGEVGSKELEKAVTSITKWTLLKQVKEGEYITFGQTLNF